jgi:hypothetical protein
VLADVAVDRDPRLRRYLGLVGQVTGEPAPPASWLLDALAASVTEDSPG